MDVRVQIVSQSLFSANIRSKEALAGEKENISIQHARQQRPTKGHAVESYIRPRSPLR